MKGLPWALMLALIGTVWLLWTIGAVKYESWTPLFVSTVIVVEAMFAIAFVLVLSRVVTENATVK